MKEEVVIAIIIIAWAAVIVYGILLDLKKCNNRKQVKNTRIDALKIRLEIEKTKYETEKEKTARAAISLKIEKEKTKRRKLECQEKATCQNSPK